MVNQIERIEQSRRKRRRNPGSRANQSSYQLWLTGDSYDKGWNNALDAVLQILRETPPANTAEIQLVRCPETQRAIIDRIMNGPFPIERRGETESSMEHVAHAFSEDNLNLLAQLRAMGHVSLKQAAERLGFETDLAFVERTLDGLNRYLTYTPTADGDPGVRVDFENLLIHLDIEPIPTEVLHAVR